jgi:polyisoprenoid-binding protein YceI
VSRGLNLALFNVSGALTVKARSSVHDTTTRWDKITGDAEADPDRIDAARGQFSVDMTSFDAGDWLKNRKLRKDFEIERHPTATFSLDAVSLSKRDGNAFEATARGTLRWRGKDLAIELTGTGSLDAKQLAADATFELDITRLGLQAPRFFMFKVEDVVTVAVRLTGVAS